MASTSGAGAGYFVIIVLFTFSAVRSSHKPCASLSTILPIRRLKLGPLAGFRLPPGGFGYGSLLPLLLLDKLTMSVNPLHARA